MDDPKVFPNFNLDIFDTLQMSKCMFCRMLIIIFAVTDQLKLWKKNFQLYGRFARIHLVAVSCCNSQWETLILGNKPIRLLERYRQRLLFPGHDIGHALKKNFLWRWYCDKNKSNVVKRCLYYYLQLYASSQRSKFFVKTCGVTLLRLVNPQHFDHDDDAYRCR